MLRRIITSLSVLSFAMVLNAQSRITQEHMDRAAEIVSQMTLDEKVNYVAGYESWYIRAIDRLGLPAVKMADGPQGVRNNTKSTLYPSGIAAAATWDKTLINRMGVALGQDSRARGVHILLGPGANIYRSPLCGRNFEYFGEDPYLAGEIAASYIIGLQSQGVMASIKHFAGNNQEYARHSVSSDIDERTLHEIYFPAFEKAVKKADVATIMTSYNLLNSVHASESKYLNYDVLRDMWGYKGLVMSDWVSCYSPLNVATWGVDLEMPLAQCMRPEILNELVDTGMLDERYLDRKCQHIIQTILAFEFDKRPQLDESIPENNPESDAVALELSRSAIVMLKNQDNFLPVRKGNIVVCGPNSNKVVTGGGSGFVTPLIATSVADAMPTIDKKIKTVVFGDQSTDTIEGIFADKAMTVPGVAVQVYQNTELQGSPVKEYVSKNIFISDSAVEAHEELVAENQSSRYTFWYKPLKDVSYTLKLVANDGARMLINGQTIMDKWGNTSWNRDQVKYEFKAGVLYECVVEHYNISGKIALQLGFVPELISNPKDLKAIKEADCIVVCLGHDRVTEKENSDRTFQLPDGQEEYLREILMYNRNVVVVLNAGGGVDMTSWLPDVKAVLMAWYPGQQGGTAISEILTGKVNPSGKLPISIEKKIEDNPSSANYYENVDRIRSQKLNPYSRVEYREGIFMGYRGYEKNNIEPLFPFGYGLSYTAFEYSDIAVNGAGQEFTVTFKVKNTGKVAGAEVAQVYVTDDKCSVVRPVKELKGFEKVYLRPGETKTISVKLDQEAFRFYDSFSHGFVVEPGSFTVSVGASSADIRLTATLVVE